MTKTCCVMVVKNEDELLEPWLLYHSFMFGHENIFVFDNGSTSEKVRFILEHYAALGVSVDYSKNSLEHYKSRSLWLGDFLRELGDRGYDFLFPLDCDEFLALRDIERIIQCDKALILQELDSLLDKHAVFKADFSYPNLLGSPGVYLGWAQKKHFFSKHSFGSTDHGFHNIVARDHAPFVETRFCYIHYHYKPFDTMVAHSREKLAMDYDVSQLENVPSNNRLGQFLHMEADNYREFVANFRDHKKYTAPGLQTVLADGGLPLPFEFCQPLEGPHA